MTTRATSWLDLQSECWGLGLGGPPIAISAASGDGMSELHGAIREHALVSDTAEPTDDTDDQTPISLSIMGRPNVGKSTKYGFGYTAVNPCTPWYTLAPIPVHQYVRGSWG